MWALSTAASASIGSTQEAEVMLVSCIIPGSTSTNITQVTLGKLDDHLKRNQSFCPTVNLDKLWTLVSEQTRVNAAENKTGATPIIDVVRWGCHKLLGEGMVPSQPVPVRATFFSRRAERTKSVGEACVPWSHLEGSSLNSHSHKRNSECLNFTYRLIITNYAALNVVKHFYACDPFRTDLRPGTRMLLEECELYFLSNLGWAFLWTSLSPSPKQ